MTLDVSKHLALPLEVAGEAVAILAKRGAGKTNTATVLVEELVEAGVQTVILDPVGAWWGIRSSADGKSAGLEVARLGGTHGDVPIEQTAGALIADVAVDSGQSLLIDLSDLPSKAAVGRFVTDFAQRLYRRKGKEDTVLHLVLEEADLFAPQKVRGSEHMQAAIEQLVRRGRSRGIGITMITQRSAVLSKDVLTQTDMLIVMRTTGPHDIRAIKEWVDSRGDEHGREVLESLPALETGEAWFWNPERDLLRRAKVRARKTFDSSRTPRAGEIRIEPTKAAPIDIAALGEQIKATAERVKEEDPKTLKARIRELQNELAHKNDVTVETVEVVKEVPVFNGEVERLEKLHHTIHEDLERAWALREELENVATLVATAIVHAKKGDPVASTLTPRADPTPRPASRLVRPEPRPARETPSSSRDTSFTPTGPHQKILDAIAWLDSIGIEGDRRRVAFLAGYKQSGTFAGYLSELSSAGAIVYPGPGKVALTALGSEHARPPASPPTSEDIHALVLGKLTGPQQKILSELIVAYPNEMERNALAEATGYSLSGTFAGYLSELSTLGVIRYPSRGTVAADPVLFIES